MTYLAKCVEDCFCLCCHHRYIKKGTIAHVSTTTYSYPDVIEAPDGHAYLLRFFVQLNSLEQLALTAGNSENKEKNYHD